MEALRNFETNLLKAFYGYAESTRQRMAAAEGQSENITPQLPAGRLKAPVPDLP
jgi:hypothetical protein